MEISTKDAVYSQQPSGQPDQTGPLLKNSRLPVIIAALGLVVFFVTAMTFSFKSNLFTNLFVKPQSEAGGGVQTIFVVDDLGNSISRVSSRRVEVKLMPPDWNLQASASATPTNNNATGSAGLTATGSATLVATEAATLAEDASFLINQQKYTYDQFKDSTIFYTFLADASTQVKSIYAKFTADTGLTQNANPFPLIVDVIEATSSANPHLSRKKADLNEDGKIDVFDVRILFNHWGQRLAGVNDGDLDGNFLINSFDFSLLIRDLND